MATRSYTPAALAVRFDSRIRLTLHQAFLSTAGVALCDPVARVHVMTLKKLHELPSSSFSSEAALHDRPGASPDGRIRLVLHSKEVAKSKPRFFTAHPIFNESFDFTVAESSTLTSLAAPQQKWEASAGATAKNKKQATRGTCDGEMECVTDYIVVTIESADGSTFYGQAYAPFNPHCPSSASRENPVRVMLVPRNAQDMADPLFLQDNSVLEAKHLDDFGFVTMSWEVVMVPHGGGLIGTEEPPSCSVAAPFPVGLTLRATWLARAEAYARGAHFTTSVEFGGVDRFIFANAQQPLCLTLQGGAAETELRRGIFHCSVQSVVDPAKSHDIPVPLPLPPLNSAASRNRDIRWTAPVRTADGVDLGLLLVTMRVSSKPLFAEAPCCTDGACTRVNDPIHQEECQHVAQLYGKSEQPHVPPGAYQPIAWESQQHVSEAALRQWKRQCIVEAQPTAEHVRHLFDVLMGRGSLDSGVARVAALFSNKVPAEVIAGDLRELMVGFAFHTAQLTVQEASRFCFVALRRDVEDAVAAEEVQYMFDHCLLEKTVEMPAKERKRWVTDLFADSTTIHYQDFMKYVVRNYALWAALGVPLTVAEPASSMRRHHSAVLPSPGSASGVVDVASFPQPPTANPAVSSPVTAAAAAAPGSSIGLAATLVDPLSPNVWRTFVVRMAAAPQKAFSVTAHAADRIGDVMTMVEESTGIKAARQEWRVAPNNTGNIVSADGSTLSSLAAQKPLDSSTLVGSTALGLPSALRSASSNHGSATNPSSSGSLEVWVYEAEETLQLRLRLKDRLHQKKEWQERIPVKEKVLKLRAAVQRKTLIPLSRCTLTVKYGDGTTATLQDRHNMGHYHLVSGDLIEVSHD